MSASFFPMTSTSLLRLGLLTFFLSFLSPLSLQAQDASQTDAPISLEEGVPDDAAILERIDDIFAQIESLQGIEASVQSGVVTLSGTTTNADAMDLAESLSSRVEGVVAVQNQVIRDASVSNRVTPAMDAARGQIEAFIRYIPLYALALGVFALILMGGWLLSRAQFIWRTISPNRFVADLISTFVFTIAFIIAMISALSLIGATAFLGTLLGAAGVVGLAIGFAVKDTIENFTASVMLSIRQPFQPNDHVVINGEEGRVIRLTSRATILMTLDGNHLRIPNANVFKGVILNYSRNPDRRFSFMLGIDPEQDEMEAASLGQATLEKLDFVLADPPAVGLIKELGASTTDLSFNGWVDQRDTDFNKARSAAISAVKTALEAAGFSLPDPSYRISIKGGSALPTQPVSAIVEEVDTPEETPEPEKAPDVPDTSPDTSLQERVDAERRAKGEDDLLGNGGASEL